MISASLPDFQEFLPSRGLVAKNHAPFYAGWVGKFFAFSSSEENLEAAEKKEKFLESLSKSAGIADWQIEQAKTALQLYFEQFDTAASKLDAKEEPAISHAARDIRTCFRKRQTHFTTPLRNRDAPCRIDLSEGKGYRLRVGSDIHKKR